VCGSGTLSAADRTRAGFPARSPHTSSDARKTSRAASQVYPRLTAALVAPLIVAVFSVILSQKLPALARAAKPMSRRKPFVLVAARGLLTPHAP
jgi:hypothetical protein